MKTGIPTRCLRLTIGIAFSGMRQRLGGGTNASATTSTPRPNVGCSVHRGRPSASIVATETIYGASLRRSEEHTSELQSLMRISYAVFCLKKKNLQLN